MKYFDYLVDALKRSNLTFERFNDAMSVLKRGYRLSGKKRLMRRAVRNTIFRRKYHE